jgi:hypothetical protein
MRVISGRRNCFPRCRVEGLRRYAFIGDSFTYGLGVAPDQTLPAAAERQMNDVCSASPVEAINFGINGYNLWNSWLGFKTALQVYNGLVVTVCCNDMELFGRTYGIEYQLPRSPTWEKTHPCGQAVESCFQEIAEFSRELSLPVAVCYYNLFDTSAPIRIGEIIRDLCASYGFPFIDSLVPIRALPLTRDDLRVSEADDHPSARVHEAVGRYLVQTLRRHGWFGEQQIMPMNATADCIAKSVRAMIETDHYPEEVAHHWALRTMQVKSHRARRLEAAFAEDPSVAITSRSAAELAEINHYWHVSQRIKAFLGKLSSVDQGIGWAWYNAEEERLKLEEVSFALGTGNWQRLAENLRAILLPPGTFDDNWPLEASEFFTRSIVELQHFCEVLATIRSLPAPTNWVPSPDTASLSTDLDTLSRLTDRLIGECYRQKETFTKLDRLLGDQKLDSAGNEIQHTAILAGAALRKTQKALAFIYAWPTAPGRLCTSKYAMYTTIKLAIRGSALEKKPVFLVTVQAEYLAPRQLPGTDIANFFSDGSCKFVTLCVPLFYIGRILFLVRDSLDHPVEVDLIKVEVSNLPSQRCELLPVDFSRDDRSRFVSPIIYLY